jgi:hypothetical protein
MALWYILAKATRTPGGGVFVAGTFCKKNAQAAGASNEFEFTGAWPLEGPGTGWDAEIAEVLTTDPPAVSVRFRLFEVCAVDIFQVLTVRVVLRVQVLLTVQ